MPPSKQNVAPFEPGERVFCFHMEMLYEARVLEVQQGENNEGWQYKIHYKGWKNTWDDWVPQDRVRKFNDENKELANQLREQVKAAQKTAKQPKKGTKPNGSDFSSARGSEERNQGHTAASGRGPRRARDYELEQVSTVRFHGVSPILLIRLRCTFPAVTQSRAVPDGAVSVRRASSTVLALSSLSSLSVSAAGSWALDPGRSVGGYILPFACWRTG
jgi:hypothetical protein